MQYRYRRVVGALLIAAAIIVWVSQSQPTTTKPTPPVIPPATTTTPDSVSSQDAPTSNPARAIAILATLETKGRAPKTGYARTQFGDGWGFIGNCDTRNIILNRDMTSVIVSNTCKVQSGVLNDPYTGTVVNFVRGADTSDLIQIDHVVALSDAWQTGAQLLDESARISFANDPLELLAVDGAANQAKGDGDAATWLPANKAFRCQYVARQIAVKAKYKLWVTPPERTAMETVLSACPDQAVPSVH